MLSFCLFFGGMRNRMFALWWHFCRCVSISTLCLLLIANKHALYAKTRNSRGKRPFCAHQDLFSPFLLLFILAIKSIPIFYIYISLTLTIWPNRKYIELVLYVCICVKDKHMSKYMPRMEEKLFFTLKPYQLFVSYNKKQQRESIS